MIRIDDIATGLEELEPGLWASSATPPVSYPVVESSAYRAIEDVSFWFRHRNRCIVELARRFDPGGLILDVGGGNGAVAHALAKAGFTVTVVEPSLNGARAALQRGLGPVICSTASAAGLRNGAAAAIGLFDVVEHVEDDIEFLRGLRAILRPRGRIFITVPAYQLLWSDADEHAGHFRRYTLRSIRAALHAAGYSVDYASHIFTALPFAVAAFRSLPWRLGFRNRASLGTVHRPLGPVTTLIEQAFAFETMAIRRGVVLPLGGSCLVAAHAAP